MDVKKNIIGANKIKELCENIESPKNTIAKEKFLCWAKNKNNKKKINPIPCLKPFTDIRI